MLKHLLLLLYVGPPLLSITTTNPEQKQNELRSFSTWMINDITELLCLSYFEDAEAWNQWFTFLFSGFFFSC